MRGILIAFDGLDSTGKATQVRQLVNRLQLIGHTVRSWQTPDYTTTSGRELKLRLQGKLGDWSATSWEEKMHLFAANRAEHKDEVVSALSAGHIVVYDRYVASSLAFITTEALPPQEADLYRDKVYQAIRSEEYIKHGMPHENISIFLDVPPSIAGSLLSTRKKQHNHTTEYTDHITVQERLYNEYDFMIAEHPERWLRIKCLEGTELLNIEAVSELVWEGLAQRFVGFRQSA